MLKRNMYFLIITFSLFISLNCFASLEKYSSQEKKFEIGFPKDWKKQTNFSGLDIFASAPPDDSSILAPNVSIISTQLNPTMDLLKFSTENSIQGFAGIVLEDSSELSINGIQAKSFLYSQKIEDLTIKIKQYFLVSNNWGYILTCSALQKDFLQKQPLFEEIVYSFTIQ